MYKKQFIHWLPWQQLKASLSTVDRSQPFFPKLTQKTVFDYTRLQSSVHNNATVSGFSQMERKHIDIVCRLWWGSKTTRPRRLSCHSWSRSDRSLLTFAHCVPIISWSCTYNNYDPHHFAGIGSVISWGFKRMYNCWLYFFFFWPGYIIQ